MSGPSQDHPDHKKHPPLPDALGRRLAADSLPYFGHGRARALAAAGMSTDPLGLVTDAVIKTFQAFTDKADPVDPSSLSLKPKENIHGN